MLVAFLHVSFLLPMEEWYSGLIPYRWLLPSQFLIILLYSKVCLDFTRGQGFFATPHRALGVGLLWFGSIYFAAMVVRYVVRMSLYPDERWLGGSIPIFFHWVLASFILLVGRYHLRPDSQCTSSSSECTVSTDTRLRRASPSRTQVVDLQRQ
jgi:hypothetical protein